MNRLVLIDGNAILHRAYHALPPLTTSEGSPVGAVYGFISMLMKIFHDLKPTHIAVAFDRAAPTFRKELFKEYQAKRPKMEDALVGQVDKVHDVVTAFGIPIYELDGFEADDIIGTITKKVKEEVIIVTGDRDILQLVDDEKVFVFMPTKGLSEGKLYGEKEVVERMGVLPNKIPEFKALAGDPSDNYPGVPGIGPKTAAKLLKEYTSLKRILKSKKLSPDEEKSATMSLELATIRTDVPITFDFEKTHISTLNTPSSRKILEDLHFSSLLKRLGDVKPTGQQQELF